MKNDKTTSTVKLIQENEQLRAKLEDAEATLEAIRSGQVDALVGDGQDGKQIYTLQSADYSYRLLVESMAQGALTLSMDGVILYCNRFFSQLVHVPMQRVIGSTIVNFIVEPEQSDFLKWLQKRGKEKHREFTLRDAKGHSVQAYISIRLLKLDSVTTTLSMVITDLTEAKRNEQVAAARTLAEQQLAHERAARQKDQELKVITKQHSRLLVLNKAKDEFISLASHQLRTPATAVKQYVGILLEGYAGKVSQRQRDFLQSAYESNNRQLHIVDDLLKVAQIDSGKVTLNKNSHDVARLLEDVLAEQRPKFAASKQKLVLEKQSIEDSLDIVIDKHLMRMAIENIIDNAGKYSPEGQTVTASLEQDGDWVVIKVADRGVGIDPVDQKKLFIKFSRVENPMSVAAGGSGLGLYWANKIVELHEGRIELISQAGQGSTFIIKIPI